jgi:hypothetical protein
MNEKANITEKQKLKTSKLAIVSLLFVIASLIILPFRLTVYRPEDIDVIGWHIVRLFCLIVFPFSLFAFFHIIKHRNKLKGKSFALTGIIFATCILTYWLAQETLGKTKGKPMGTLCGTYINELGKAIKMYEGDFIKYPDPNKWCDLLIDDLGAKPFICYSGAPVSYSLVYGKIKYAQPKPQKGNCSYAINPDCEPNSSDDTVLLFETKIGWNQAGGPEILNIENHQGKGCHIVFNDGHNEFIKTDQLKYLRWK